MNPVHADPDETVRSFWKRRLLQHSQDTYRGRRLAKMPEDLRTYQHVIEDSRPEVIVELGTFAGGSALWFADQLIAILGRARVITLDLYPVEPGLSDPRIVCLVGDLADPKMAKRVHREARGLRTMVVDDSGHTAQTTTAALELYSDMVSLGCWFVVEDGIVDEPDLVPDDWNNRGVQPSVQEFLNSMAGRRFDLRDQALYGLTTNIGGWLQAIA